MVQALGDRATRLRDGFLQAARLAPSVAVRVVRHPLGTGADMVETARSIGRTVQPLPEVLSPVMTQRGPGRVLHTITVSLDELKQAGAVAGGTLNDSFMAGVTGGLRRYHEHHGATVAELTVTMPISIRKPDDPPGGNRITLQRLRVPLSMADPVSRMRAIGARCRAARAERSLAFTDAIAGALNLVPNTVIGNMLKHVDFLASDVPGFPYPIFLCGARVTGYYAFGPTIGAAMNATLFSYDGSCCIGITVDTTAIPDDKLLTECLLEGFAETIGAGRPKEATVPC